MDVECFFSENMSDIVLTTKPYQLVNSIRSDRKAVTRSVDITLFKWIRYEKIKKRFITKYMSEPYTDERTTVLYDLIEKKPLRLKIDLNIRLRS